MNYSATGLPSGSFVKLFLHSKKNFILQSEGHKNRASCRLDLFRWWVILAEAWPILNEMALGQQFPAGLHCIIQLFWTRASTVSELAAAIELLLPPICTQLIEWLLQPRSTACRSVPGASWTHTMAGQWTSTPFFTVDQRGSICAIYINGPKLTIIGCDNVIIEL